MEITSSQSLLLHNNPINGVRAGSPLIRRRGVTIDELTAKSDAKILHSCKSIVLMLKLLRCDGCPLPIPPHSMQAWSQEGSQFIEIILDTPGSKEVKQCCHFGPRDSLRDILSSVTDEHGVDLSLCQVVLLSQPDILPDLSCQASESANQSILILSPAKRNASNEPDTETDNPVQPSTVDQCIAYFSCYGLKPFDGATCMSPKLHTSLIKGLKSWEDLLDQETIEDFTEEEEYQQQAIWELLYTEYTYLTQLAIVINTFMKCLEYMQSINLLTEVNYHTIFGQMRDLYRAHSRFWNITLLPCLQKAANDCKPLDINDLITDFPQFNQLFKVYEHHCIVGLHSMQALDEAMSSTEFSAYIKWCETKPECKRLRLKDFLAKPMQRLTKYPLLLKAILSKTSEQESKMKLQDIISMVDDFVCKVNAAVRHQEEIEKVKSVVHRLATMSVSHDLPSGWEKCLQPYSQLDLLAPMAGINTKHFRTLIMEGALRYKEDTTKLDAHVFLFTDMLLITRPSKKSPNQLVITKAPFKIDSLIVKPGKDPALLDLVCLNELKLISTVFSLKATTPQLATSWIESIKQAQQLYYRLRCNYEIQLQHQLNLMVWSDTNQLNGVHHFGRLSGSELSSHLVTVTGESTIRRHDTVGSSDIKKRSASTWPSPPIFYVVTQDSSTQTSDMEIMETPDDKKCNKQSLLKMITVKRSASFGDHRKERPAKHDGGVLSHSSSSLRREDMIEDLSVQKPKRSKSLKIARDASKVQ